MIQNDTSERILIVDDNEMVHEDFRKFLDRSCTASSNVDEDAESLFGNSSKFTTTNSTTARFEIDWAFQGAEGVAKVSNARESRRPYAVAFIDVRMPPGIDGVDATEKIFAIDPDIQVVLCTAYSDYSMEQLLHRFNNCDRILILKKPFDVAAASMMAVTLCKKWELVRQANTFARAQEEQISDANRVIEIIENSNIELQSALNDTKGHSVAEQPTLDTWVTESSTMPQLLASPPQKALPTAR